MQRVPKRVLNLKPKTLIAQFLAGRGELFLEIDKIPIFGQSSNRFQLQPVMNCVGHPDFGNAELRRV